MQRFGTSSALSEERSTPGQDDTNQQATLDASSSDRLPSEYAHSEMSYRPPEFPLFHGDLPEPSAAEPEDCHTIQYPHIKQEVQGQSSFGGESSFPGGAAFHGGSLTAAVDAHGSHLSSIQAPPLSWSPLPAASLPAIDPTPPVRYHCDQPHDGESKMFQSEGKRLSYMCLPSSWLMVSDCQETSRL